MSHDPKLPPVQAQTENPYSAPVDGIPSHEPSPASASVLDVVVPTNPLAMISCYSGILGFLTCIGGVVLGPIALVTGYLALKPKNRTETEYGKTMSSVRAWIGIVTGALATIGGLLGLAGLIFGSDS